MSYISTFSLLNHFNTESQGSGFETFGVEVIYIKEPISYNWLRSPLLSSDLKNHNSDLPTIGFWVMKHALNSYSRDYFHPEQDFLNYLEKRQSLRVVFFFGRPASSRGGSECQGLSPNTSSHAWNFGITSLSWQVIWQIELAMHISNHNINNQ